MNEMPTVSCQNLHKTYQEGDAGLSILKGIDFSVMPGETVSIVGASGAGKSTFLQLLGGLDQPTAGEVFLQGQSLQHLSERLKCQLRSQYLGFVYQFHHLLPELNALENVCIPLLIRGLSPRLAKEKASYYIEQVNLANRCNHRIGELSGGERQRIAIARALVGEPQCVLADEPTGNLDQQTADHIIDLLLMLNQQLTMSFVVVTHNLNFAKRMNRSLVLETGVLKEV